MESQHQNPEFRNNPENFLPCKQKSRGKFSEVNGSASTLLSALFVTTVKPV